MANKIKPLTLSIIIPVYNEESNIDNCLRSIENQTVKPDEVIVVDNNSSDSSIDIAKKYSFVKIIKEKQQGIFYARNKGYDACKSEIIARIDGDSILAKNWVSVIKKHYSNSANDKSAISGTGNFYNLVFPPASVVENIQTFITFKFNKLIVGHNILWGSNMAMKKDDWLDVREKVCEINDIHEDLDLAIHLHKNNVQILFVKNLKVTAKMKRVLDDWTKVYPNLLWWPRTLKIHGKRGWVLGMFGAYFLLVMSVVTIILNKPVFFFRAVPSKLYGYRTKLKKAFSSLY